METVVTVVKPWYQSRTIWVAALQAVAGILTAVVASDPHLQTVGWTAFMKSAVDVLLRFLTNTAVDGVAPSPPAPPSIG